MRAPIVEVLWKNGHVVQVSRGYAVLWKRKAGKSRRLLRKYLEAAAKFRKALLAAAVLGLAISLAGCGGTGDERSQPAEAQLPTDTCVVLCAFPGSKTLGVWCSEGHGACWRFRFGSEFAIGSATLPGPICEN